MTENGLAVLILESEKSNLCLAVNNSRELLELTVKTAGNVLSRNNAERCRGVIYRDRLCAFVYLAGRKRDFNHSIYPPVVNKITVGTGFPDCPFFRTQIKNPTPKTKHLAFGVRTESPARFHPSV
jgi:hypothetical protein